MGYDISFHPINQRQMNEWYFEGLTDAIQGKKEAVKERAIKLGLNADFVDTYSETMFIAAETESHDSFEKTHVYYLAVIQGLFNKYYYVRGSALSFLIEEHPEIKRYLSSWNEIKPVNIPCPVTDRLVENYSGSVYLDETKVGQLVGDIKNDPATQILFRDYFGPFYTVFENALTDAASRHVGLMEASEVIEPDPFDLNNSSSYSNLLNCDPTGALIFQKIAINQLREVQNSKSSD